MGLIVLGLVLVLSLSIASLLSGRADENAHTDHGMSRSLKPVHEPPRHGRVGQPLMLSPGHVKLVITPTRLLDPVANQAVGGYDERVVGLEVRTTNVGHESYGLSAEDVNLRTARKNAALPTELVKARDCLGEAATDAAAVRPGSTTTACYPFEAERGEGLENVRIVVRDGGGTATGIWSLR